MNQPSRAERLVIVGCAAGKADTSSPLAALDLYQDWCFPRLRAALRDLNIPRDVVWVLSGLHGLISADTPLLPYDQPLTEERAAALRPAVDSTLTRLLRPTRRVRTLVLLVPAYMQLITPTLLTCPPAVVHWIADPVTHWQTAADVLGAWSGDGPCPAVEPRRRDGPS